MDSVKWARFSLLWRHPWNLLWVAAAYLPFLNRYSVPLTGDQKVYLNIALEMQEKGSWLQPYLFGEPSYFKPPLQYWMTLLGWKVFGFGLFGALVPSVLAMILTGFFIVEIAKILTGKTYSYLGLAFAAMLSAWTYGTTAQMEIYVCLFYAAAWWAGLKWLQRPERIFWIYLAFGITGVSALVKSPLYSVFWTAGFFSFLAFWNQRSQLKRPHLYFALLTGICLGAAWYLYIFQMDPQRFYSQYVLRETLEKKGGNDGSVLSLWLALLYFCAPFTLLIGSGLFKAWVAWKKRAETWLASFLLAWAWPPAIFFSFYPYRVKTYLFILVPVLVLTMVVAEKKKLVRWSSALLGVVFFLGSILMARAELLTGWLSGALVLIALFYAVVAYFADFRSFVALSLAAITLLRFSAVDLGEQDLSELRLVHELTPESEVGFWDPDKNIWHERGLIGIALQTENHRIMDIDRAKSHLLTGGILILSEEEKSQILPELEKLRPQVLPWSRLQKRIKFPYWQLISHGKSEEFETAIHRDFYILKLN